LVGHYFHQIILVVSFLLTALSGSNFSNADYNLDEKSFTTESLKLIEEHTSISLPVGSRGLHMFYQESQCVDPSFVAKVEIPEASKDLLIKQIEGIQNIDFKLVNQLAKQVKWWEPSNALIYIERKFTSKTGNVHILVCYEHERWVIYVEWNSI